LKGFRQVVTRLGEQQLLFFHTFDGFGGLRFRDGTGSRGFGKIAAKPVTLRTVLGFRAAQLVGEYFCAIRALDRTGRLCFKGPSQTSRPPEPKRYRAETA
jgi:hypothetical protein